MFRLVALFAVVAIAVAEPEAEADPQWLVAPQWPHLGFNGMVYHPNGAVVPQDTASVKAAKVQHLTAKANEYAMKGHVPYAAAYAAPYAHYAGAYSGYYPYAHHYLGKREAESDSESDSQYLYNYNYPSVYGRQYNNPSVYGHQYNTYGMHNTYGLHNTYGMYNTYNAGLYNRNPYTSTSFYHHLGKRDADSDSQYAYSSYPYSSVYNNYPYTSNFYRAGHYPYSAYNTYYSRNYAMPRYFY